MRLKSLATIILLTLSLAASRHLGAESKEMPKVELPTRAVIDAKFDGVDRVVVKYARQGSDDKDYDDKILFEFDGRDALAALQKTIEFDLEDLSEFEAGSPCFCYGTHDIYFYKRGVLTFSLNYKHFSRLGGLGDGEFDLTSESAKKFAAWFDEHGFHDFQKWVDKIAALRRAEEDKAKRAAEFFPKDYRQKIPPYSQIKFKPTSFDIDDIIREREESKDPLEGRSDRLEILKAAFRAIGTEYGSDEYMGGGEYRFDFSDIEPVATLTAILKAGKTEDIGKIAVETPQTDARLLLGIFQFMDYHWQDWQLIPEDARAKIYSAAWKETVPEKSWKISSRLSFESGPHCMQLRLKIAAGGNPVAGMKTWDEDVVSSELLSKPWLKVLLTLSRQRVPEARAVVLEKLKNAPDGFDKLVLEVALACYDGPGKLTEKHYELKDDYVADVLKQFRAPVSK